MYHVKKNLDAINNSFFFIKGQFKLTIDSVLLQTQDKIFSDFFITPEKTSQLT